MSTQTRLPGYGIALNEGADRDIPLDKAFPNALLGQGYWYESIFHRSLWSRMLIMILRCSGPLLTVREYTMMEFMNRVTDKMGWETKGEAVC